MIAPKISKEIYALISSLAQRGATIVLVDQNVRSCAAIADYLYILELGRNKAEGDRSVLRFRQQSPQHGCGVDEL